MFAVDPFMRCGSNTRLVVLLTIATRCETADGDPEVEFGDLLLDDDEQEEEERLQQQGQPLGNASAAAAVPAAGLQHAQQQQLIAAPPPAATSQQRAQQQPRQQNAAPALLSPASAAARFPGVVQANGPLLAPVAPEHAYHAPFASLLGEHGESAVAADRLRGPVSWQQAPIPPGATIICITIIHVLALIVCRG